MGRPSLSRLASLLRTHDLPMALGLLLICTITRLMAFPASLWEWDDINFANALHHYNVGMYSPHPPGFPVLVAMGRLAYWALKDEHLALSAVSFVFASLLGPALYYFYLEVFSDRRIALAGALLGIFAPNVWVQSCAARSDGVAFTLGIIGLALVIRGLNSQRALIAGCAVFGLAMGVRVTLLPVMGPVIALVLMIRLWRREWKSVAAALASGSIFVLLWFVPFIYLVSWSVFRKVINVHSEYTWNTDSIFAPGQYEILSYRLERYFIEVWGGPKIMLSIYLLSSLGLIALILKRRWKAIGWMALAFIPFMIFTVMLNTPLSAPLYALPYIPFFIGLAACGLIMVPDLLIARVFKADGARGLLNYAGLIAAVILTIGIGNWTYPVVRLLHREVSPPVRAMYYLKQWFDPGQDLLPLEGYLLPHTGFYLPEARRYLYDDDLTPEANLIGGFSGWPRFIGVSFEPLPGEDRKHFGWDTDGYIIERLRRLSLGRYFDVYVSNISKSRGIAFISGWYKQESGGERTWRWMGREAKVALLNVADSMTFRLRGAVANLPESSGRPTIIFRLDGSEIDRFTPAGSAVDRSVVIRPDAARQWSVLSIESDQTYIPLRGGSSTDDRELGIQCFSLEWFPAAGAQVKKEPQDYYLGTGWYYLESNNLEYWRWTAGPAIAHLPAVAGDARLDLKLMLPENTDGAASEVTVEIAGKVIDKFKPSAAKFLKTYYVPETIHHNAPAELKLTAPVVRSDNRPLAIGVSYLGWRPAVKN